MEMNVEESVKNQYIAAIVINLMVVGYGCGIGWISPTLPLLTSDDGLLEKPLTPSEISWVGSLLCIGGLLGTPIYGWISDKYGRKKAVLCTAVPFMLGWIFKMTWKSAIGMMIARIFVGFGGGGGFLLSPTYTVEIASVVMRGALGSLMVFSINFGIVSMYVMGAYLSYNVVLSIMIVLPLVFFVLMLKMPETPIFLLKNNREKEAIKAVAWLRNLPSDSVATQKIVESIKYDIELANESNQSKDLNMSDSTNNSKNVSSIKFLFTSRPTLKAFLVYFALLSVQCYVGMFAIVTYAYSIFEQAGSKLSPNNCAIIIGALQFTGSVIASLLIERTGRKILLFASCTIVSLGMFTLGLFFYLKEIQYDVSAIGWIPVTAISFTISTFAMGIGPVPYLLPSEMMMVQGRGIATTIAYLWVWISSFLISQFYIYFVDLLGMYSVFWGFSFVGTLGILITLFCMPETKGKPFEDILDYYRGGKTNRTTNENGEQLL